MPREYDPRRYGQLSTESRVPALPISRSAPAPSPCEVLSLMMMSPTSRLLLNGRHHGEGGGGGGGGVEHSSLVPTQVIPYDPRSHVRLALPEDVLTALAGLGR